VSVAGEIEKGKFALAGLADQIARNIPGGLCGNGWEF
jgi:hypothetical protein